MNSTTSPGPGEFRDAMSLLATGVTVVTTMTADGPAGMTASAVCSLSLEPPQLVACVERSLPTHAALLASETFAVNVLSEEQVEPARRFATPGVDRFAGIPLRAEWPAPVLSDAIAYFVCTVEERHPGGDHSIFVGRVRDCSRGVEGRPLLYFGRAFGVLQAPEDRLLRSWSEFGTLV